MTLEIFLAAKILGNGEDRHDRITVEFEFFHFFDNLRGSGQRFRNIGKQPVHFGCGLEPFLFGIPHPVWIIQVFAGIQANQQIMCIGIFGIDEMDVIGRNQFDAVFPGKLDKVFVYQYLLIVNLLSELWNF